MNLIDNAIRTVENRLKRESSLHPDHVASLARTLVDLEKVKLLRRIQENGFDVQSRYPGPSGNTYKVRLK